MKLDAPHLTEPLTALSALPDEDDLEGLLLEGIDLSGEDLHGREWRGCILRKCCLAGCDLRRAGFVDVVFDHCDLS